jgi:hypothetical protein
MSKNPFFRAFLMFLSIAIILGTGSAFGQGFGSISGKVIDKNSNEVLIGASVSVVGTTKGATSDLEGTYSIKRLTPGMYSIKCSYVSFQSVIIENIKVEEGKDQVINIQLSPASVQLNEVVVKAEMLKASEGELLSIQRNSINLVDGVSTELIKKNNSSDGTDILKRMTGVTISDGKYAVIRGVGDRYNSTMLNGANLPGTDPEKKSVSYDLFPSALIENIITNKTASPDKRADFSGGLVQIKTIDFPAGLFYEIGLGSAYNTISNLKSGMTYNGGKYDFAGIDDGARDLPSIVPNSHINSSIPQAKIQEIGRAFPDNWDAKGTKMPLSSNFKFAFGNTVEVGEGKLGFIGSLTYSNNTEVKDYTRNYYNYDGPWYNYDAKDYSTKILWGGLFNLSYKISPEHKFSFKNLYNQNTDNMTMTSSGEHYYVPEYRKATVLQFLQRSLFSSQLMGEHVFDIANQTIVNWNVNYSQSKRKEPDTRKYWYSRELDAPDSDLRFAMNQATATRFYSDLKDDIYGFSFDVTIKPFEDAKLPSFKTGVMLDKKQRSYTPRTFGFDFNQRKTSIALRDSVFREDVNDIFSPQNINPDFIYLVEVSNPPDKYDADERILGSYLMMNFTVFDALTFSGGFRYENAHTDLSYIDPNDYNKKLNITPTYSDILPSINATLRVDQAINIKSAFSKTLARPELRELAHSGYYDFLTDDYVYGNPDLKRTVINNFDLRAEYYPTPLELYSVGFFYKHLDKPIEIIGTNASGKTRTWKNADNAKTYGLEIEVRKNLSFIGEYLKPLSFISNISLIKSEVDLGEQSVAQAELERKRPLQGQADYIINLGLYYDDYENGFLSSLIYNKVGSKILTVGVDKSGDVIEKPRDIIDFMVSKKILGNLTLKFAVKDLLAQDLETVQQTFVFGDKTADKIKRAPTYSLGFTYRIN